MTPAMRAIAKAQVSAITSRLKLEPDEIVAVAIEIAVWHSTGAGIDRRALHALIDDALALRAGGERAG